MSDKRQREKVEVNLKFFSLLSEESDIPEVIRLRHKLGERALSQRFTNNHQAEYVAKGKGSVVL